MGLCPACLEGQCRGGGNKLCRKRDPRTSCIAGILDCFGGVRVVVTHPDQFQAHLGLGEYLCLVPSKTVHEPIAWGDHPYVIALGELAVEHWVDKNAMTNDLDKQAAIRAYRARKTWYRQKSLDTSKLVFT
jgi:hypothetical protein